MIIQRERNDKGGNEDKVTERAGEDIIRDFHKRLDRWRISVAIIAVRMYDVAASNEDGSLSANQTGRAILFSFPTLTCRWRNSRGTGWSAFNQVSIALSRKIVVCDRHGTSREIENAALHEFPIVTKP